MNDDDPRLLRFVRDLAEGVHVDWEAALQLADEVEERPLFLALSDVAHIAWFHRTQQLADHTARPGRGAEVGAGAGAGAGAGNPPPMGSDVPGSGAAASAGTVQRWGHLELRRKLGEGVFGEVFLAWDPRLEREVALKLIRRSGDLGGMASGSLAPHLLQEARNLARLRHANVVAVYGAELAEDRVGIWMEHVNGETLEDLLRTRGPFGAREAALVGIDLCRALTAVHRAGLVHRDVKAKNVMRESGGRIVLMDFGTGIDLAPSGQSVPGTPAGTPVYLAPEIFKGQRASAQSDLYSLGVLLYHLVSGGFPAEGETLRDIALVHTRGAVRLLRGERPDLPESFHQAVERALAPRPEDRFPSAAHLEQALAATLA